MSLDDIDPDDLHSLEESIGERRVIPVLGPDAVDIDIGGESVNLYARVAAEVLKENGLAAPGAGGTDSPGSGGTWVLHRAVQQVLASGRVKESKLRRTVSRLISELSDAGKPGPTLLALAAVPNFHLYASLTPDNLIDRALAAARPDSPLRALSFAPQDATDSRNDDWFLRDREVGVFRLLGTNSAGAGFAIHEEDALEFLFQLQSKAPRQFSNALADLRRMDLLFVGCGLPDWLGRSLLRLVNDQRLASKQKLDFHWTTQGDPRLRLFLDSFSSNTVQFDANAGDIVPMLVKASPPPPTLVPAAGVGDSAVQRRAAAGTPGSPSVFVSYASEDLEAARLVESSLRGLGFGKVWFDKKELVAGDDWSDRLVEAIKSCDFFVPLLSRQADGRRAGEFWWEWETAVERSLRIKGAFILPVGIDADPPTAGAYPRIASGETRKFFDKQLIHAPAGRLGVQANDHLTRVVSDFLAESTG